MKTIKLDNPIRSVQEGYKIVNAIANNHIRGSFLTSVVVILHSISNTVQVMHIDYMFSHKKKDFLSKSLELYTSFPIVVDNYDRKEAYIASTGGYSTLEDLIKYDPDNFPPPFLNIESLKYDTDDILELLSTKVEINEFKEIMLGINIYQRDFPYWSFRSERKMVGFYTFFINASNGELFYTKFDQWHGLNNKKS